MPILKVGDSFYALNSFKHNYLVNKIAYLYTNSYYSAISQELLFLPVIVI